MTARPARHRTWRPWPALARFSPSLRSFHFGCVRDYSRNSIITGEDKQIFACPRCYAGSDCCTQATESGNFLGPVRHITIMSQAPHARVPTGPVLNGNGPKPGSPRRGTGRVVKPNLAPVSQAALGRRTGRRRRRVRGSRAFSQLVTISGICDEVGALFRCELFQCACDRFDEGFESSRGILAQV
jgi:hypothetical protein